MTIATDHDAIERPLPNGLAMAPLFQMQAELNPPLDGGKGPEGRRIFDSVARGSFEGEKLRGKIAPGLGDWRLLRHDGVSVVDARLVLQTDDGAVIHMRYGGRIVVPSDLIDQVRDPRRRHLIDPALYYFRITPVFETGAPPYAWLNDVVSVGTGRITEGPGVAYEIFQVL